MAFGWDDLIMLAATAYGASATDKAAGKQAQGGRNALAEQQRQFNLGLTMLEPQRGLGYGAMSDIASLYGYRLPGYTPLGALGASGGSAGGTSGSSNWAVGSPISVQGRKAAGGSITDTKTYLGGGGNRRYGATIDPSTGTVNVKSKRNEDKKSALATDYLRGNEVKLGKRFNRIRDTIDGMRSDGYQWTPGQPEPTAGPAGEAGNMDRFFTSPDYQFRRDEGQRDIGNSFAARGGAASGNALRALAELNQSMASSEYGNYTSRLMQMAGMGQAATSQGVNLSQNYGNNAANTMQNVANSRASGVMGTANTVNSGANSLMNYWLMRDRLGSGSGYTVPSDIRNFQYPFGG